MVLPEDDAETPVSTRITSELASASFSASSSGRKRSVATDSVVATVTGSGPEGRRTRDAVEESGQRICPSSGLNTCAHVWGRLAVRVPSRMATLKIDGMLLFMLIESAECCRGNTKSDCNSYASDDVSSEVSSGAEWAAWRVWKAVSKSVVSATMLPSRRTSIRRACRATFRS